MRWSWIAAVALAAVSAPAFSDDSVRAMVFPTWVSPPPSLVDSLSHLHFRRILPPTAQAVVQCHRSQAAALDHCLVVSETSGGWGLGDLAATYVSMSDAASPPPNTMTPAGDVIVPISFDVATAIGDNPASARARVITSPNWLRRPDGNALARSYPARAMRRNLAGRATLICRVLATGALEGCRILAEAPEGYGFGAAALAMAPTFSMSAKMVDGEPVDGGVVVIPVTFALPNGGPSPPALTTAIQPAWTQTPTPQQLADAFPKDASGVGVGRVVLSCAVTPDGKLAACQVVLESPAARGFGDAAKGLAADFTIKASAAEGLGGARSQISVPITFYAPGTETIDPISQHIWTRWVDRQTVLGLFPSKASDAGVRSGGGVVDCVVDHAGQLTQCRVIRESPPDLGFGAAIVQAANMLAINPWTLQGRPVDGAHLLLPLTINLPPPPLPPPPPPAPQVYGYDEHPDWIRRPDADDIATAYPSAAHGLAGLVKLDCPILDNGYLGSCVITAESPQGVGFGDAPLRLARFFAMRPVGPNGKPVGGQHVILPISLRAP